MSDQPQAKLDALRMADASTGSSGWLAYAVASALLCVLGVVGVFARRRGWVRKAGKKANRHTRASPSSGVAPALSTAGATPGETSGKEEAEAARRRPCRINAQHIMSNPPRLPKPQLDSDHAALPSTADDLLQSSTDETLNETARKTLTAELLDSSSALLKKLLANRTPQYNYVFRKKPPKPLKPPARPALAHQAWPDLVLPSPRRESGGGDDIARSLWDDETAWSPRCMSEQFRALPISSSGSQQIANFGWPDVTEQTGDEDERGEREATFDSPGFELNPRSFRRWVNSQNTAATAAQYNFSQLTQHWKAKQEAAVAMHAHAHAHVEPREVSVKVGMGKTVIIPGLPIGPAGLSAPGLGSASQGPARAVVPTTPGGTLIKKLKICEQSRAEEGLAAVEAGACGSGGTGWRAKALGLDVGCASTNAVARDSADAADAADAEFRAAAGRAVPDHPRQVPPGSGIARPRGSLVTERLKAMEQCAGAEATSNAPGARTAPGVLKQPKQSRGAEDVVRV